REPLAAAGGSEPVSGGARAVEADQERGSHAEALPRPLERPRGGAHRGHRPPAVHAEDRAAGARGRGYGHAAAEPRRDGLGWYSQRSRAARGGAALSAHRQGGLSRRGQEGGGDGDRRRGEG